MASDLKLQSFQLFAGDDIELPITVRTVWQTGDLVDLTGASARFIASRTPGATPVLDSDASPALVSVEITTPLSGLLTVIMAAANTAALLGDYYWQVDVTDNAGKVSTVAHGWLSFIP